MKTFFCGKRLKFFAFCKGNDKQLNVSSLPADINDCASSPCKNGGTCIDGINSFQCFCPNGWEGSLCDVGKYECDNDCVGVGVWKTWRGFLGGRCEQQHKFTSLGNSLNKSCCLWVTHPTATKEWSAVWESLEDKTMEDLFWQSKRAEKCGNLASWLILNLFCEQHMPTNTVQFVLSVCTFADDTIAYIT